MKKIRLTESDLKKIVERVIKEQHEENKTPLHYLKQMFKFADQLESTNEPSERTKIFDMATDFWVEAIDKDNENLTKNVKQQLSNIYIDDILQKINN